MNKTNTLIKTIINEEDIRENGEGFDSDILLEVMAVKENEFSRLLTGAELLAELMK